MKKISKVKTKPKSDENPQSKMFFVIKHDYKFTKCEFKYKIYNNHLNG